MRKGILRQGSLRILRKGSLCKGSLREGSVCKVESMCIA